jgi:hypothetical protein
VVSATGRLSSAVMHRRSGTRWQRRPARGRKRGVQGWARPAGRPRLNRSGGGWAIRANWAKKVGQANLAARAETKEEFLSEF